MDSSPVVPSKLLIYGEELFQTNSNQYIVICPIEQRLPAVIQQNGADDRCFLPSPFDDHLPDVIQLYF